MTKEERKIYQKEYYRANREELNARMKEWRQNNRDKILAYQKEYRKNHPEKISAGKKEWRQNHPEEVSAYGKEWYQSHKEERSAYHKEWRQTHREEKNAYKKEYYQSHKEEENAYHKEYQRNKMATDPKYRLNNRISSLIRKSLKGSKAGRHWETLVGYTYTQFKKQFEKQFQLGMNLKNHGRGPGKWHIDHIIPIDAFNFTKPEDADFKRCWALSNLQPMWGSKNMSKGAKLEKPFQPSLIFEE
ncbi:MAG TPA: hypothetical protein ENH60_08250 [Pricia sp.]|nr:hypothetical protein [Pricia sp.]